MKNHHAKQKPRTTSITFDFGKPVAPDGVRINPLTGVAEFRKDGLILSPEAAVLETTYARSKGPKVVTRIPIPKGDVSTLALPVALWRFQRIYAVDTNTRSGPMGRVSVGVVTVARARPYGADATLFNREVNAAFEFRNVRGNPEPFCWRTVLSHVSKAPDFRPKWRGALIVDSELDRLTALNTRAEPICDEYYLPPNIDMLYASGDTQADSVVNAMLATSDRFSGMLLDSIVSGNAPDDELCEVRDLPFTHFRMWLRVADEHQTLKFRTVDPKIKVNSVFYAIE